MQALELLYNRRFQVDKAVILAATDKTSSYSCAFNEIARQAIHIGGKEGLSIARQLGFLTYRSSKSYDQRFTPEEVVSYQQHQGNKFKESFDLSCYLTLLDVLDSHNIDRGRDDVDEVFKSLDTKVLTMGFIDDLLYPDDQVLAAGQRFKYHRHFLYQIMWGTMVSYLTLKIGRLIYITFKCETYSTIMTIFIIIK